MGWFTSGEQDTIREMRRESREEPLLPRVFVREGDHYFSAWKREAHSAKTKGRHKGMVEHTP